MPTPDGSASAARALSRKRRLHPLAIIFPFNSYSRPPLLGRSIRIPRWVWLSILFVVILIVDYFSDSLSVRDDGGILIQRDEFTWVDVSVLIIGIGAVATVLLVRWWSFRWWIEDDAIWTSGGIFNEWRRRVTFGRIVTIDRSSTPVRRLFGASRIAIETTAVDQAAPDVLFGYLSNKNANLLEDLLIAKLVFARQGQRGKTVRSAQRRSARVVGSVPCRSDDIPDRSRPGGPVRRNPLLSGTDRSLDRHQVRDHGVRTPTGSIRDRPIPRHHRRPVARVDALFCGVVRPFQARQA